MEGGGGRDSGGERERARERTCVCSRRVSLRSAVASLGRYLALSQSHWAHHFGGPALLFYTIYRIPNILTWSPSCDLPISLPKSETRNMEHQSSDLQTLNPEP